MKINVNILSHGKSERSRQKGYDIYIILLCIEGEHHLFFPISLFLYFKFKKYLTILIIIHNYR